MRKRVVLVLVLTLVLWVSSPLMAEEGVKGLPAEKLAKYCDPFVNLRGDLWERQQYTDNEAKGPTSSRVRLPLKGEN